MSMENQFQFPELVEDLRLLTPPPERGFSWLWVGLGLLALLILVIPLVWVFRSKNKQANLPVPEEPKPDPSLAAMAGLRKLRAQLTELGEKEVGIEVARIMRVYVCDRFDLRAPYQTSSEFLKNIQEADSFPEGLEEMVGEVLAACDRMKFAAQLYSHDSLTELIDAVEYLITVTPMPVEEETHD
ncbi:hypothetical protein P3T73_00095 [Kiritimatiellota bacterium B12222]|nr:hypothetical protein P3T73_00095 [Kiritimatiellota bacterium B12222]